MGKNLRTWLIIFVALGGVESASRNDLFGAPKEGKKKNATTKHGKGHMFQRFFTFIPKQPRLFPSLMWCKYW